MVTVAVEPTRAILYLNSGAGLRSATNTITHANEEFNGPGYLGWDTLNTTRRLRGALDEVRVCNRALTASELQTLYMAVATPASCVISSPVSGSVLGTSDVTLTTTVFSNGNLINKVEYVSGGTILGAVRTPPYPFVWTNLASGTYTVQARTYFSPANYTANSSPVSFTVAMPITASMSVAEGQPLLQWIGGRAPYQVQMMTNLAGPVWEDIGPASTNTSLSLLPTNAAAYYRVAGH